MRLRLSVERVCCQASLGCFGLVVDRTLLNCTYANEVTPKETGRLFPHKPLNLKLHVVSSSQETSLFPHPSSVWGEIKPSRKRRKTYSPFPSHRFSRCPCPLSKAFGASDSGHRHCGRTGGDGGCDGCGSKEMISVGEEALTRLHLGAHWRKFWSASEFRAGIARRDSQMSPVCFQRWVSCVFL